MDARARIALLVEAQGASKAEREIKGVGTATGKLGDTTERTGKQTDAARTKSSRFRDALKGMARWAKYGAVALGGLAAVMGKQSVEAAVDLSEQINKTKVVFRGSERTMLRWSQTTDEALGISRRAALESAGVFGNMLVPMGFARREAGKMSRRMVKLAADMASFNNATPEETLDALRAGLAGETEPLRRFGVFLNDARLKQEALKLGLKDAVGPTGALNANAKAMATYSVILKDTGDAQGDFERTSDSLANKQRILAAQWENLQAKLGAFLIPAVSKAANALSDFLAEFEKGDKASQFAKDLKEIAPVAVTIGKAVAVAFRVMGGTVKRVVGGMAQTLRGMIRVGKGFVDFFAGVFTLDFRRAWNGIKSILRGAIDILIGTLRTATAPIGAAANQMWRAIKWPFDHVVKPIFDFFADKVEWLIEKINWVKDNLPDVPSLDDVTPSFGSPDAPKPGGDFDKAFPGVVPRPDPDARAGSAPRSERRTPTAGTSAMRGLAKAIGDELRANPPAVYLDGEPIARNTRRHALRSALATAPD